MAVAVALIQPLAWELPNATGAALKKQTKTKQTKTKNKPPDFRRVTISKITKEMYCGRQDAIRIIFAPRVPPWQ